MSLLNELVLLADTHLGERFRQTNNIIQFLETNWIKLRAELIDRGRIHLSNYNNNPDYSSSLFTGTELKFHATSVYEVAVNMVEPRESSSFVSTLASDAILLNIGNMDLMLETYRLPAGWSHEVFDPTITLTGYERHWLQPGTTLSLCSDVLVPRVNPPTEEPALLLKIAGAKLRNLVWNFSPISLQAQFAAASWVTGQRLKVAAKVLGSSEGDWDREKVIPTLRHILTNENHDVRWAALESLCLLDAELGTQFLRDAMADSHPHIATAARRTLDRLGITYT